MARRLYQVNSAPDFSFLDEPVLLVGSTVFTLRRLLALLVGLAAVGLGLMHPVTTLFVYKGIPFTLGFTLGLAVFVTLAILSFMGGPGESRLGLLGMILLALEPDRPPRRERRMERVVTVRSDEETGVARLELEGYAFSPRSGEPLAEVDVEVDGERRRVKTARGRYYLELELPRGVHTIRVLLPGSEVELRSLTVRVV